MLLHLLYEHYETLEGNGKPPLCGILHFKINHENGFSLKVFSCIKIDNFLHSYSHLNDKLANLWVAGLKFFTWLLPDFGILSYL